MRALRRALSVCALILWLMTACGGSDDDGGQSTTTLPANLLASFGADPSKTDTDGDGLSDEFEITRGYPFLRPDSADSDGNNVRDGDQDNDDDGLTNLQEQAAGTSPLAADTDGDRLSDFEEVNTQKTNPLVADTDGDGIPDGREVANGSDPLVADANKVVTSRSTRVVIDPDSGLIETVGVAITGAGDLAGQVTIRPASDLAIPGQIGRRYDITLPSAVAGNLRSAEITLPFDGSVDPSQVAIFTVDPATGFWSELPTTVDGERKLIVGTTTHFSEFVAANKDALAQANASLPKTCDPTVKIDAALVIDSSGSMSQNDPANLRKLASKQFVASMKPEDRSAVVDFDDGARLYQGLTAEVGMLNGAIDRIDSFGGTDIGSGVSAGLSALGAAQPDRARVIILLTDGQGSYDQSLTARMVSQNIRVFAIGLSSSVDAALLRGIAQSTGGIYQQINNANQLPQIFAQYATVFGDDGTDTDQDGLTDCQEIQGVYVQALGRVVRTLHDNPDSDGDGMTDGAEVGLPQKVATLPNTPYTSIGFSDPNLKDTDGDGISDPEEFRLGTNAVARDSDGDGILDLVELSIHQTDPNSGDSDGDGFGDLFEVNNSAEGYDPITRNFRTVDVVRDFFVGFVVGDIGEVDTIPKVLGQIGSGIIVLGDIRDVVANLWKNEVANAALSGIGLIPVAGDIAKSAGIVGKFIAKHPTQAYDAVASVERFLGKEIATQVIGLPVKQGAWLNNPFVRGRILEEQISAGLPGTKLLGNYPLIDVFSSGKATSIKTIDFDAKTYQNIANFERKVNKYAGDLRSIPDLNGSVNGLPFPIRSSQITSTELILGIPRSLPADYVAAIDRVRAAHPRLNIVLTVVQ